MQNLAKTSQTSWKKYSLLQIHLSVVDTKLLYADAYSMTLSHFTFHCPFEKYFAASACDNTIVTARGLIPTDDAHSLGRQPVKQTKSVSNGT